MRFSRASVPLLSPRETKSASLLRSLEARDRVVSALDPGRIGDRADDDEVVPRELAPVDAVALGDEFRLGVRVVDEDEIGVAAPRRVERLAGAERQDMHGDAR